MAARHARDRRLPPRRAPFASAPEPARRGLWNRRVPRLGLRSRVLRPDLRGRSQLGSGLARTRGRSRREDLRRPGRRPALRRGRIRPRRDERRSAARGGSGRRGEHRRGAQGAAARRRPAREDQRRADDETGTLGLAPVRRALAPRSSSNVAASGSCEAHTRTSSCRCGVPSGGRRRRLRASRRVASRNPRGVRRTRSVARFWGRRPATCAGRVDVYRTDTRSSLSPFRRESR